MTDVFTWYFSWANGENHRSGFKPQIVTLPLLWCVMSLVLLFFVKNLLNIVLVLSTGVFKTFTYNSRGPNDYLYDKDFHVAYSLNFYT
jgi:hypothetical protein